MRRSKREQRMIIMIIIMIIMVMIIVMIIMMENLTMRKSRKGWMREEPTQQPGRSPGW